MIIAPEYLVMWLCVHGDELKVDIYAGMVSMKAYEAC